MLQNKRRLDEVSNAYKYIGQECGYNMYLTNIRENTNKKQKLNLDDALLDDDNFPNEYYKSEWKEDELKEDDDLSKLDFFRTNSKECQYLIYKQLVSISSSLSDIKEVLSGGNESK